MKKVTYKTNTKILMVSGTKYNMLWVFITSKRLSEHVFCLDAKNLWGKKMFLWSFANHASQKCQNTNWYVITAILLCKIKKCQVLRAHADHWSHRRFIYKANLKKTQFYMFYWSFSGSYWSCQSLVYMQQCWDSKSQKAQLCCSEAALSVINSGPGALA